MSEKHNNPEMQKPAKWYDTCNRCKTKYEISENNAAYANYSKKPECNFLYCKCTKCGQPTRIYDQSIAPEDANLRNIILIEDEEYPSDHIYEEWFEVNGYELPEEYTLTPRQEALAAKFGETISAAADKAPELFWSEIEAPQGNRTMPDRWT